MPDTSETSNIIADLKEQVLYLQELGVDSFDVNLPDLAVAPRVKGGHSIVQKASPPPIPDLKIPVVPPLEARPPGQSRLASLPSLSKRGSSAVVRPSEVPNEINVENQIKQTSPVAIPPMPQGIETIDQIRAEIGPDCTRCKLSKLGRSRVVNSTGNMDADLMFVGEAPGKDEDEQGFPFVGRAGKLLTDIMGAIGFGRDDVFIGNINRCRPPENRAPEPDETIACKPFLQREIAVVRPKVIVVLGATAAQNLLETKVPIGKLRGQFHDYLGTKVMPTFHPAYLLRDPHKKREVWEDMKMVRDYLASIQ